MPPPDQNQKKVHTISLTVANKPGVLVRIALVFARRGYNIDSLVVSPTFDPRFSRMTITAQGDIATLDQIIKQADKLIDVIHVSEHTGIDSVHTEMALMKARLSATSRPIVTKQMKRFNCRIIDDTEDVLIIEQTGTTEELDEFEAFVKKYGMIEIVRTGKIVMAKGHSAT